MTELTPPPFGEILFNNDAEETVSFQERVTVQVDTPFVTDIDPHNVDKMIDTFYNNGIVILELETPTHPELVRENLLALTHYFGKLESHKHSKGGIVDITTTPGMYKPDGVRRPQSDNGMQSPHTDGASGNPPEIVALGCFRPAAQGGESIFIDMQTVFKDLWAQDIRELSTLFLPNATTVYRGEEAKTGPVFIVDQDKVRASYSNHEYNRIDIGQASQTGFTLLDRYIKNPINQSIVPSIAGSIAIFDNSRILHGRNMFQDEAGKERWLMRAWYDNNSNYMQASTRGFKAL
jgi:alpha-ketoglutarate-dependent taurine dioxygenase